MFRMLYFISDPFYLRLIWSLLDAYSVPFAPLSICSHRCPIDPVWLDALLALVALVTLDLLEFYQTILKVINEQVGLMFALHSKLIRL